MLKQASPDQDGRIDMVSGPNGMNTRDDSELRDSGRADRQLTSALRVRVDPAPRAVDRC
jgi:hypothetical protein